MDQSLHNGVLSWLSGKVPKASEWSKRQAKSQLRDPIAYENHIRSLARCETEYKHTVQHPTSRAIQSHVGLAERYAGAIEESSAHLEQMRLWLSFRRLVFFSVCLVLKEHGSSESDVDALMWWTREDEKKRKSILRGTKWMHQTILSLVKYGWTVSRATELFLLVPLSNDSLVRLASKPSAEFAEKVENPDIDTQKPYLTPNFTFPTLIEQLYKGHDPPLGLAQICAALGYEVPLPTPSFYHVSRGGLSQTELQIEFFRPHGLVERRWAPAPSERISPQKRQKQHAGLPSAPPRDISSDERHEVPTAENSSILYAELVDFLTLIRHFRVESFEEDLLLLGVDEQYRWDEDGNIKTLGLEDTRLSQKSIIFFQDKERIRELLRLSVHHGLLRKQSEGRTPLYHVVRRAGEILDGEDPYIDSLIFLCHICPRDEAFSERFFATTKRLRPALTSWFKYLLERPALFSESLPRDDLIAACIATLKMTDFKFLQIASQVLERLCNLGASLSSRLAVANVQSTVLRRNEHYADSDHVLQNVIAEIGDDNIYHVYLSGQLYLSLVENSILRNQHALALEWLNKISLSTEEDPEKVPILMWRLLEQKWTTMGRIYRFTGDFQKAKGVLEPCLGIRQYLASHRVINTVRQLADVLVELGDFESARKLLDYHLKVLHLEGKEESKAYNKLLLSYADAELRMEQYDSAQARLVGIRRWFDAHSPTSQTDQLDHVRALIVCMRIQVYKGHWSEVLEWSTKALQLANQYACVTTNNHYKGFIRKVRATCHLQLAHADMEAASKCVHEPRHYMTGVGTYDGAKAQKELCKALENCTSFDLTSLGI